MERIAHERVLSARDHLFCHLQEGRYAWVPEGSNELRLVSGAPPSFLHCSRQGQLPGCLFMFDQVDQQCAEGRTGEVLSLSLTHSVDVCVSLCVYAAHVWSCVVCARVCLYIALLLHTQGFCVVPVQLGQL